MLFLIVYVISHVAYIILYYIMLYYIILYYIILFYISLCYIISYYIIFFCTMYCTYSILYTICSYCFMFFSQKKHINFGCHFVAFFKLNPQGVSPGFRWRMLLFQRQISKDEKSHKRPTRLFRGFVRGWYPTQFCGDYFYKPWNKDP